MQRMLLLKYNLGFNSLPSMALHRLNQDMS